MVATRVLSPEHVDVTYRTDTGAPVATTLDRVMVEEVSVGRPVRELRWYQERKHYSGWHWSSTTQGMIIYESRLELSRIILADFYRSGCIQNFSRCAPARPGKDHQVKSIMGR